MHNDLNRYFNLAKKLNELQAQSECFLYSQVQFRGKIMFWEDYRG